MNLHIKYNLSNSNNIMVSVCCITYNHESYIKDAIDGFLSQIVNFNFEIIIHDDASTDNTAVIIREYEAKCPELIRGIYQVANQYSLGVKPFQSYVVPVARGRYIALCEGDDYWVDPHKLQRQVDFLESNCDYVICYTEAIVRVGNVFLKNAAEGFKRDLTSKELQQAPSINTLTVCFRNVFCGQPEFCLAKYEDKTIWSFLGHYGKGKYLSYIRPSVYRVHMGGMHSAATFSERCKMDFITYASLFSYYKRIKNIELENYFFDKATDSLFSYYKISPKLINIMKFITYIRRFFLFK